MRKRMLFLAAGVSIAVLILFTAAFAQSIGTSGTTLTLPPLVFEGSDYDYIEHSSEITALGVGGAIILAIAFVLIVSIKRQLGRQTDVANSP